MTITIMNLTLNLFVAVAVFAATVVTDAVYVLFTARSPRASAFAPRIGVRSGIASPPSR
jgi:hypothetical protein